MKLIYLALSTFTLSFFLTGCANSDKSTTVEETISAPSELNGIFTLKGDTLRINALSDSFGKSIEFELAAHRVEAKKMIFNEAPLLEQSKNMEHYQLKNWITGDTSYVAYELLDFTFNFNEDQWTITDTVIITDQSASLGKFINAGGVYRRVK